jgi:flagellar biosynthesis/type III secretory pathway protein FliH
MEKIAMMFEHDFRNYTEVLEYRTLLRGRREGREEGLREGLQEGRQEGLQEGWQEGQQEGAKNALLAERRNTVRLLLEHAGKPLSQAGAQVLEQATPEQLLNWIHALIDSASVPPELLRR